MFNRLQNALFWHNKFDDRWRHCSMFLRLPDIGWRIEEKRSYWREHGKSQRLKPDQAVFRALEDIANSIYAEHSDRERMQATWLELAYAQYYAASSSEWDGQWVPPESRLSDRWKSYYAAHCVKRENEQRDKKHRAAEVQSHRFNRELVDEAWIKLLEGDVDREVKSIWRHSVPPRKSAHEIASQANVSIKDFVFWMVVLRDHGLMSEEIVLDEHLYCNQQSWLESCKNLGQEEKLLLDILSDRT